MRRVVGFALMISSLSLDLTLEGHAAGADLRDEALKSIQAATACISLAPSEAVPDDSATREVRIWFRGMGRTLGIQSTVPYGSMVLLRQESTGIQIRAYRFVWKIADRTLREVQERDWETPGFCAAEMVCAGVRFCRISDERGGPWQQVWDYLQFLRIWNFPDSSELPGFTSSEEHSPSLVIETRDAGADRMTMYDTWGVADPVLQYRRALEVAAVADGIEMRMLSPHYDRIFKSRRGGRKKR